MYQRPSYPRRPYRAGVQAAPAPALLGQVLGISGVGFLVTALILTMVVVSGKREWRIDKVKPDLSI